MNRDIKGKYAKKWYKKWSLWIVVAGLSIIGGGMLTDDYAFVADIISPTQLHYVAKAEAAELPGKGLSLEQLEAKLDDIVWGKESDNYTMKEGDIFETFDPASSEYQRCITKGGRQPKYCLSRGPRQIKLTMIQTYWPQMHNEQITDKEGRDIAEGNESSRRFFLDCAATIGTPTDPYKCAEEWTSFNRRATEGQIYIDLIREARGITI